MLNSFEAQIEEPQVKPFNIDSPVYIEELLKTPISPPNPSKSQISGRITPFTNFIAPQLDGIKVSESKIDNYSDASMEEIELSPKSKNKDE